MPEYINSPGAANHPQTNNIKTGTQVGAQVVEITPDDLPLHCPMPGDALWNLHPKVYLPIEKKLSKNIATGGENGGENYVEELCPYCGTRYILRQK